MSNIRMLYRNLLEQTGTVFLNSDPVIFANGIGQTNATKNLLRAGTNWNTTGIKRQMALGGTAATHFAGTMRVPDNVPTSLTMALVGSVNSSLTVNVAPGEDARFDSTQGLIAAAGYPMSNLFDGDRGTVWDNGTSGAVGIFLEFDLGGSTSVGVLAALGNHAHSAPAGGLNFMSVDSASSYGTWTNRASVTQPDNNNPDLDFGVVFGPFSARYWRIELDFADRADVARLWLGAVDQDLGGLPVGSEISRIKPSSTLRGPSGRPFYSQNGPERRTFRIPWSAMTTARRQKIEAAFDNHGVSSTLQYRTCVLIDDNDQFWEVEWQDQTLTFTRLFVGVDRGEIVLETLT